MVTEADFYAPTIRAAKARAARPPSDNLMGHHRFTGDYTDAGPAALDLRNLSAMVPDKRFSTVFGAENKPQIIAEIGAIKVEFRSAEAAALADWDKWLDLWNEAYLHINDERGDEYIAIRDACGFPVISGLTTGEDDSFGFGTARAEWMDLPGGSRVVRYAQANAFRLVFESGTTPLGVTAFPVDVWLSGAWAKLHTDGAEVLANLRPKGCK